MSYLGSTPASQFFAPGTDTFSGDGTTVAFTLSRNVGTVNDILVVVNNVDQQPTAYSVSVSTLTFTAAPSAGTNNIYVRYLSTNLTAIVPQAGSIVPGNFGIDGNLNFSGSARRITGDFSNATAANRVIFQTSTVNGGSSVGVIPNGTGTFGQFSAYSSSDPNNSSVANVSAVSGTDVRFVSGLLGTGTYLPMTFYTGGSERMRIDTSGNVGIGTTTSGAKLNVSQVDTTVGALFNGTTRAIRFGFNTVGSIIEGVDNTGVTSYQPLTMGGSALYYTISGVERMRLDTNGFLLVGATDRTTYGGGASTIVSGGGVNTLTVANTGTDPYGIYVYYSTTDKNNTTNNFLQCAGTTTVRASIRSNGGLANFSANNVNLSDRREKTNFAPAGSYLSKICAIPVQTFNYIDQNLEEDDGLTLGVVAQDVQAIAPELVTETDWGTKDDPKMRLSVYQTDLQYALMKCIQEQQAMIEELKTKVAALEAR